MLVKRLSWRRIALSLTLLAAGLPLPAPRAAAAQVPAGGWHGLTADIDVDDQYNLYSVPITGSVPVKLNPPLVAGGGQVNDFAFEITPDSSRVIYRTDQDVDNQKGLYSVPTLGGAATKLNLPVAASISDFRIATGQAIVFFVAEPMGGNAYQLYAVDTVGGTVLRRSHDLNPGENVLSFQISPAGGQVVYDVAANNKFTPGDLYANNLLAGPSHILTVATPGFGVDYLDYTFTPDGSRLVCIYQQDAGSPKKLVSLNATGAPVISMDLFVPDTGHSAGLFRISPDGQWVVFQAGDDNNFNNTSLSAIPTTGGNAIGFGLGMDQIIAPDSQRVIFRVPSSHNSELFSAQIFGGGPRNLSRPGSTDYPFGAQLSPDGQWIVYETQLVNAGETLGYQLRASDGSEAPLVFNLNLPLVQK